MKGAIVEINVINHAKLAKCFVKINNRINQVTLCQHVKIISTFVSIAGILNNPYFRKNTKYQINSTYKYQINIMFSKLNEKD